VTIAHGSNSKELFDSETLYFEEFQYGKDVFQTTTKLCPSGVSMKVVTHFPFNFGYSNIE